MSIVINESDLKKIGKEDAWKYFTSIFNVMDAAKYYRFMTKLLLEEKTHENLAIVKGDKEIPEEEKYHFPMGDLRPMGDIYVSRHFLIGLCVKNFFQYARNAYDYVSQIINEILICDEERISNVDFAVLNRTSNIAKIECQEVVNWLGEIFESEQYIYINDYSNQTKHNYDIGIREVVDTSTLDISCKIPGFTKCRVYESFDGLEKLQELHQFVADSLVRFMEIMNNYIFEGQV